MNTRNTQRTLLAAALAVAAISAWTLPALARRPPVHRPCVADCQAQRGDCRSACNADFRDCLRPARLENRTCRQACAEEFEADTPELEECEATCREEILAPALETCADLRQDCRPICDPGNCRAACRGDEPPVLDECKSACVEDLRACAAEGKAEMRECVAPCRELETREEVRACVVVCAESLTESHMACRTAFEECAGVCDASTTTTTLP
jgi:hypothetical protein